jgi:hypothetical protein
MIRPNLEDLCFAGGRQPYGPNWVWNGSGWSFVRCDLVSPPGSVPAVKTPYQSAFSGSIDGSADIGIPPIVVPGSNLPVAPNVGGIPVVDVEDEKACSCGEHASGRSIWWLVGIGLVLWML